MDGRRFDALAGILGTRGLSRRSLAAALAALATAAAEPAAARRRRRCQRTSPPGQCCRRNGTCTCRNGGTACGASCCVGGETCAGGVCVAPCTPTVCPSGCAYPTLADALAPGGPAEILVAPGIYLESGLVIGRDVEIGVCGPDPVVLDGGWSGGAATDGAQVLKVSAGVNATLRGIVVENGRSGFGGCIAVDGQLTFIDGIVANCLATSDGGGIFVNQTAGATLRNAGVMSCRAAGSGGGILNLGGTVLLAENSGVYGCEAALSGGGIANRQGGSLTVAASDILVSVAANGGGIANDGPSTAVLDDALVSLNTASVKGGGIHNQLGQVSLGPGVIVSGNTAGAGSGVYVDSGTVSCAGPPSPPRVCANPDAAADPANNCLGTLDASCAGVCTAAC